uniref:Uncharacterized protein n=1 Tax=Clandestinovirus TaxID=2831644 RepID=A0A8F8KRX4_9VIRU|nr:hypothetical protein KOM_12_604 [Clandestinovirus]
MSRLTTKDFTSRQQAKALSDQVFVALNNSAKPSELSKITLLHNGAPHLLSVYEVLALQTALNVKFWRNDSTEASTKSSKSNATKKRKRVEEPEEEPAKKKAKNYHYYPVSTEEKTGLKILGKAGESLFSTGMFESLYKASVVSITGSADVNPHSTEYAGRFKTKPIARVASRLTGAKDENGMFAILLSVDSFC